MNIIGTKNAGRRIIDVAQTSTQSGYVLAENENEYVTWWFRISGGKVDYEIGHYMRKDPDSPYKSKMKAYADLYERALKEVQFNAKYGR